MLTPQCRWWRNLIEVLNKLALLLLLECILIKLFKTNLNFRIWLDNQHQFRWKCQMCQIKLHLLLRFLQHHKLMLDQLLDNNHLCHLLIKAYSNKIWYRVISLHRHKWSQVYQRWLQVLEAFCSIMLYKLRTRDPKSSWKVHKIQTKLKIKPLPSIFLRLKLVRYLIAEVTQRLKQM